jgi:predicted MFS family arabinose efflux permease
MSRTDRILAVVTTFAIGAMIALVVSLITPDSNGQVVGWMIIGGAVGMLVGVPLSLSIWRRQRGPLA